VIVNSNPALTTKSLFDLSAICQAASDKSTIDILLARTSLIVYRGLFIAISFFFGKIIFLMQRTFVYILLAVDYRFLMITFCSMCPFGVESVLVQLSSENYF
jgi:hypothetical protein